MAKPGAHRKLDVAACSQRLKITEPSPSNILHPSTCTAAHAEPEAGYTDKSLNADSDRELKQSSKADTGKAFRDPLSESVTETIRGGSVSRRTVPEDDNLSGSHPLSEDPCRLPLKKWECGYPDSPMNVHIQVNGQNQCCPNSYREEPLGVHAACCHSVEVPMLQSSTSLSENNTSDDETLLVC